MMRALAALYVFFFINSSASDKIYDLRSYSVVPPKCIPPTLCPALVCAEIIRRRIPGSECVNRWSSWRRRKRTCSDSSQNQVFGATDVRSLQQFDSRSKW
jgi:hypothetical protein